LNFPRTWRCATAHVTKNDHLPSASDSADAHTPTPGMPNVLCPPSRRRQTAVRHLGDQSNRLSASLSSISTDRSSTEATASNCYPPAINTVQSKARTEAAPAPITGWPAKCRSCRCPAQRHVR
jgi:hypothetical protein